MADSHHRELERRWRETGAVADGAAFLRQQVRTGALSEERLRLAAYADHPAARAVLGPAAPEIPDDAADWLCGLEEWSTHLAVWALSKALADEDADQSPTAQDQFVRVFTWLEAAFRSGTVAPPADWPDGDSREWVSPRARQLRRAVVAISARHYLPTDDQEIERATDEVWGVADDPERWIYNHSAPNPEGFAGWTHHFVRRDVGRVMWRVIDADSEWRPSPDTSRRVPAGRLGEFAAQGTYRPYRLGDQAAEASRRAVREWALSP